MKVLSNPELSAFCGQMAMVLRSGISPLEGVSIMLEDAKEGEERILLAEIRESMARGNALSRSLSETHAFPDYLCRMISVGEETGKLDDVCGALERHYERQEAFRLAVKSALTYPLIMTGMMALVVAVLLIKVMPVFQQVFRQMGMEMEGFSRGALLLGQVLSRYAWVFVAVIAAIILLMVWCTKARAGQAFAEKAGRHVGFIRRLYDMSAAGRFISALSMGISSGLTQERSLSLAASLNTSTAFGKRIRACEDITAEQNSVAAGLRESGIVTGLSARMCETAARAGKLDEVLEKIADDMGRDADSSISGFISAMEPTLVILLSVVVGVILLSVMLPLLGMLSGI